MAELQRPDGPEVVLASASPARAALLRAAGVRVVVRPAAVDEDEVKAALRAAGAPVEEAAVTLAGARRNGWRAPWPRARSCSAPTRS
jgi:septum formation protein